MSWSYSGDPRDSELDAVRFLAADTDTENQLVQDEEILYVIGVESTTLQRAVVVAHTASLSLAKLVDKSVGDLKLSLSQRYKNYMDVVAKLEDRAGAAKGLPYAGGISVADKTVKEANSDRVKPAFKIDMNKNTRLR